MLATVYINPNCQSVRKRGSGPFQLPVVEVPVADISPDHLYIKEQDSAILSYIGTRNQYGGMKKYCGTRRVKLLWKLKRKSITMKTILQDPEDDFRKLTF